MPALLLHLTAVDLLASEGVPLPPHVANALDEDQAYARFGVALPLLPGFSGIRSALQPGHPAPADLRFAHLLHEQAPVAFGLKMAELVANGALVGSEPGLALVSGYFLHLCLDRVLFPLETALADRLRRPGEPAEEARERIAWQQALFLLKEKHGLDVAGHPVIRRYFHVTKNPGLFRRGIGRGIYEVVRLAAQETLFDAPEKQRVDAWTRGLAVQGAVLGSPLGKVRALPEATLLLLRDVYRGERVDFPGAVQDALRMTANLMERLSTMMAHARFSKRARQHFLAEFPEGSPGACVGHH